MQKLEERTFVLLLAITSVLFAWLLWPFSGAILWGTVLAIVFAPLYRRLKDTLVQNPSGAALITIIIVFVMVILPLAMIATSLMQEAAGLYDMLHAGKLDFGIYFHQVWDALPIWVQNMMAQSGLTNLGAVQQKIVAGLRQGSQFFVAQVLSVGQFTFHFIIDFFIMMYLSFFLLRDGDLLFRNIRQAIPLHAEQQRAIFTKFTTVVRATVKGGILVAALQGTLGGLMFWFLDIHAPLLWGVLMAFLSLLPAIGAGLVWLPVAIYLLATGVVWQGILLIAFGALVMGLVDNLLRPALVGKDTKLPDYVVLISTLGGLELFGLNGLVIGPAIAALFIVIWAIFSDLRQGTDRSVSGDYND
ncbi:AI-2E family transporter [Nitrosomonas sp. JL21]|nr:AI-2E family transporter [Nitrosomonas sp.]MBL8498423.1 AI-2E family transporter [Nitrosomonas sp.]MCC7092006.1 AI-2E family transporter [Nitrosomonas sp.]MXS77598.1 AI-2E family transporter [Nitrosomonas sp. JL21]